MKNVGSQSQTPFNQEKHDSIDKLVVQCANCFKFRLIPTQEEYEKIRANFKENPWLCDNKPNVSCDDPTDIELDNTRTWVIDKPNLPISPAGFRKGVKMRKDYSRMDPFYYTPTGQKVRWPSELEKFLEANPEYKDEVDTSEFAFTVPKIMGETVPKKFQRSSNKK